MRSDSEALGSFPLSRTVSSENIVKGTLGDLNPSRLVAKGGRVLDPNGKPVAKAVVNVVAVGGEASEDSPVPEVSRNASRLIRAGGSR